MNKSVGRAVGLGNELDCELKLSEATQPCFTHDPSVHQREARLCGQPGLSRPLTWSQKFRVHHLALPLPAMQCPSMVSISGLHCLVC